MVQWNLSEQTGNIKADESVCRVDDNILQSPYKFTGVLDCVGIFTCERGQDPGQFLGKAVHGGPNVGNNGSHGYPFLVDFGESIHLGQFCISGG